MKTVELDKATASLADYAREIASEPLILTAAGRPVAALVSITNADAETVSLSTNPQFAALIERARGQVVQLGGLSVDEVRNRLTKDRDTPPID